MILLSDDKILLRDFEESDIEKRIYWETIETEWQLWDGPWEYEDRSEEEKKKDLEEYIKNMHNWVKKQGMYTKEEIRSGFQICIKETMEYIGWCTSYFIDDECNYAEEGSRTAIGIDLPERNARGNGYAFRALCLFIDYLLMHGQKEIYTQTWSGNHRMIRLAKKMGFEEFRRKSGIRTVRGMSYDGLTFCLNQEKYRIAKKGINA